MKQLFQRYKKMFEKQLLFLSCYIADQKKINFDKNDKSMYANDDSSVQMNKNEVYELVKGMPTQDIYEN